MAFRKPITTLGGLFWWIPVRQNKYFIMQEHRTGPPIWPYTYRILTREDRFEIANSNNWDEIEMDWRYLEEEGVPQADRKIDVWELFNRLVDPNGARRSSGNSHVPHKPPDASVERRIPNAADGQPGERLISAAPQLVDVPRFLKELRELKEDGTITAAEFEALKTKAIGRAEP